MIQVKCCRGTRRGMMQGAVASGYICIPIPAFVSLELYIDLNIEICRMDSSDAIYLARSRSLPAIHFYLPLTVFFLLHKSIQPLLIFLHFGHSNLTHCCGLLKEWLERCLVEKDWDCWSTASRTQASVSRWPKRAVAPWPSGAGR